MLMNCDYYLLLQHHRKKERVTTDQCVPGIFHMLEVDHIILLLKCVCLYHAFIAKQQCVEVRVVDGRDFLQHEHNV